MTMAPSSGRCLNYRCRTRRILTTSILRSSSSTVCCPGNNFENRRRSSGAKERGREERFQSTERVRGRFHNINRFRFMPFIRSTYLLTASKYCLVNTKHFHNVAISNFYFSPLYPEHISGGLIWGGFREGHR